MALKIAVIGAGSVGFTRKLMRDILSVPELQDTHFALTDISQPNLDLVTQLCQKDIRTNKLPAKVSATTERRKALRDADYVICCVRVGGLEAFKYDIDIPLKYGVDQCVGDTICAGGIMYAQRTIPQLLAFGDDIMDVAKPGALLLNYANPMAMNCWALLDHGVNVVGLCHGIEHGWGQIAEVLGAERRADVDIICAGINHQTWFTRIEHEGREIGSEELLAAFEAHPVCSKTEKVRIDVLRRFGYYSTESNGHSVGVPAVVPEAAGGDPALDRPLELGIRRNRRVPADQHREAQLVRDRLPGLDGGGRSADRCGGSLG